MVHGQETSLASTGILGFRAFACIEFFYNPKRKHGSNNNMLSPFGFEGKQEWKLGRTKKKV